MKFPYNAVSAITPDLHGFYRIGHEAYHAGIGLSSSKVKRALHGYAYYAQESFSDSAALAFGRAFHAALIEPELFARKWIVQPQFPGHANSNAYKDAKAAWIHVNAEKEVLAQEEAATIAGMIRVVKRHNQYDTLANSDAEIMGITTDLDTGLKLKCKCDLLGNKIIDFKSTSADLANFMHEIINFGYHISAAFYQDIVRSITGEVVPFVIVAVRKKEPIDCEFFYLTPEMLDLGRQLYKAGIKRIVHWEKYPVEQRPLVDKRLRMLYPNARMVAHTKEVLEYIGG